MSYTPLEELQNRLSMAAETLTLDTELSFRPMFGGVTGYMAGRVFASLSNVGLALKLPPDAQAELLAVPGAKRLQYEPDSPPSKQSIVVPTEMLAQPDVLATWVRRSVDHVLTLPASKPKAKKAAQG